MLTKNELEEMFASTETYHVERTKSTTGRDKLGEAVCAFMMGRQIEAKRRGIEGA